MRNSLPLPFPDDQIRVLNTQLQQAQTAFRTGQAAQAQALCLQILVAAPGEPHALHLLGIIANAQGQLDKAAAYIRRACLSPHAPAMAFADLGEMLRQKGQAEQAESCVRKAIALNDKLPNAWNNLGVILQHNGDSGALRVERLREARACFDSAIILQPDYFEAYWNRGTLALLQGECAKAWPDFEWRKRKQGHNLQIASSQPIWSGLEDLSDKTILVHWEQGLGDTLQFCRYIERLTKAAGKVLFWPQKALMGLMRQTDLGSAEIVDFDDKSLQYDYRTPLMSLPVIFKTELATIPSKPAYIKPDSARVTAWRSKIGTKGFKIGISWKGSSGPIDAGRSIPLTHFLSLLDIPEVRLISLQKFEGLYQLHSLPRETGIETLGDDFDAGPDAFMDSAAVMTLCDLVITSDTAIAHLAGALGVPTWVGLKQTPDWRWLLDRQDSPWYPSMRLYRQQQSGDWDEVFAQIAADLRRLIKGEALCVGTTSERHAHPAGAPVETAKGQTAARAAPSAKIRQSKGQTAIKTEPSAPSPERTVTQAGMVPLILPSPHAPVSWGEFIDKLTILEIKSVRIQDQTALAHVMHQLSQLFSSADSRWKDNPQLLDFKAQLRVVNEILWEIADELRQHETKQDFGEGFIRLARSAYQHNDQRAALRRAINTLMHSDSTEEKHYKA